VLSDCYRRCSDDASPDPGLIEQFSTLRSIASQLPVRVGTYTWTGFNLDCGVCQRRLPSWLVRGHIVPVAPSYREIDAISIEAVGFCCDCERWSHAKYMFHGDGSMTGRSPKTREMTRWVAAAPPSSGGRSSLVALHARPSGPPWWKAAIEWLRQAIFGGAT